MTGTERLNRFLSNTYEKEAKPEGMCSKLFWELHNLIRQREVAYATSSRIHTSSNESR